MRALAIALALCSIGCARSAIDRTLGWSRLTTEHVQLDTDADPRAALAAAMQLEAHDRALAHVFPDCPNGAAAEPFAVIALSHAEDFDSVRQHGSVGGFVVAADLAAPPAPETVVLSLDGSELAPSALQAFAHHLAHRLLTSCLGDAPAWLQEGLATYYETLRATNGRIITGVAPFHFTFAPHTWTAAADGLHIVDVDRRTVEFPTTLEAERAFYVDDEGSNGWRAHLGRYPAAWTIVHMLILDGPDDVQGRLPDFLAALAAQTPETFETAFADVAINRAFHHYLHDARITEQSEPYVTPEIVPPRVVELEPAEADVLWMRLFARRPWDQSADELAEHFAFATEQSATHVRAVLLAARVGLADPSSLEATDAGDIDVVYANAYSAHADSETLATLLARPDLRIFDLAIAARIASELHRDDEALALARNVVHLAPGQWWTHAVLGTALQSAGQNHEAQSELRRSRRSHAHWWGTDD